MPRDIDDDEPVAKPKKGTPRKPARDADVGGPWKALGITFGCVLAAFAGIMLFAVPKVPKVNQVTDATPGDAANRVSPDGVPNRFDPFKPNPGDPKKTDLPTPMLTPDDWTPPPWSRPPAPPDQPPLPPSVAVEHPVHRAVYLKTARLLLAYDHLFALHLYDLGGATAKEIVPPVGLKTVVGLAATPDATAVFAWTTGGEVHRFDVTRRTWTRLPVRSVNVVVPVSADRFLARVDGDIYSERVLRLYHWDGTTAELTATAEWPIPGVDSSIVYDPATGTAHVHHSSRPGQIGSSIQTLGVSGRGFVLGRQLQLPIDCRGTPHLSWDGTRLYVARQTIDLPTGTISSTEWPSAVVGVTRGAVATEDGNLRDEFTGQILRQLAGEGNTICLASDATVYWANDRNARTYRAARLTGPPATPIRATELARLPAPESVFRLQYSDKHDILVVANAAAVSILDTSTGSEIPLPKLGPERRFRRIELALDQSAVFASDGMSLHRLNLSTRTWESRRHPGTSLLALDGSTVLAQVNVGSQSTFAVLRWGAKDLVETSRIEWRFLFEMGYDAAAKSLFVLHGPDAHTTTAVLQKYAFDGTAFRSEWMKKAGAKPSSMWFRPLTGDGKYFFYSNQAWATGEGESPTSHSIHAFVGATNDAVVSATGKVFATGDILHEIGSLPLPPKLMAASADGSTVWMYHAQGRSFIKYKLERIEK